MTIGGKVYSNKLNTMPMEVRQQYLINAKLSYSVDELTSNLPHEVSRLFRYVRSLKIYEKPDYSYMRKMLSKNLTEIMGKQKINKTYLLLDWVKSPLNSNRSRKA